MQHELIIWNNKTTFIPCRWKRRKTDITNFNYQQPLNSKMIHKKNVTWSMYLLIEAYCLKDANYIKLLYGDDIDNVRLRYHETIVIVLFSPNNEN